MTTKAYKYGIRGLHRGREVHLEQLSGGNSLAVYDAEHGSRFWTKAKHVSAWEVFEPEWGPGFSDDLDYVETVAGNLNIDGAE